MIELLIPMETPSQNVSQRWHWTKRAAEVKAWTKWFIYTKRNNGLDDAKTKRHVSILAYRKRLCTDQGNLEGGCKQLLDGLVNAGLLVDDKKAWMTATYDQALASKSPTKKPCTKIVITENAP